MRAPAEPRIDGAVLPLVRAGSEPMGHAVYAYILFAYEWDDATGSTNLFIAEPLAARYQAMLDAIGVSRRRRLSRSPVPAPTEGREALFCVPALGANLPLALQDYGARLSLAYLQRVQRSLEIASSRSRVLRRPGPYLLATKGPLPSLSRDAALLVIDLTDSAPGSFQPLLMLIQGRWNGRPSDAEVTIESLRDDLAPLAQAAKFGVEWVRNAATDR